MNDPRRPPLPPLPPLPAPTAGGHPTAPSSADESTTGAFGRRACLRCLGIAGAAALLAPRTVWDPLLDPATFPDPQRDEASGHRTPRSPDLLKQLRFDEPFPDDIVLRGDQFRLLKNVLARLDRTQRWLGHGHFNLLGFDGLLASARHGTGVGRFPRTELDFLEQIFYTEAETYGFFGEKVLEDLTCRISENEVVKIAGTGHYLFRGASLTKYQQILKDLGDGVILTSGVRGLVKQFHLFFAKAEASNGNLSLASRSLAPPGYSYHAAGDFDVGKVGLGADNFTARFSETDEFRRLLDLGYVGIRYPEANPFGVRFEPWHIRTS